MLVVVIFLYNVGPVPELGDTRNVDTLDKLSVILTGRIMCPYVVGNA